MSERYEECYWRPEPTSEDEAEWQRNTWPADWKNPTPSGRYNLVVIGAGTAGLVAAAGAAGLGARVALIEGSSMGGDCLNDGCVPTKAILRSARAAATARRSAEFGVHTDAARVDYAEVIERMSRLQTKISRHDSVERFRKLGVDVYLGYARFISRDAVEVLGTVLKFHRAVVATGAFVKPPEIPGIKEANCGWYSYHTILVLAKELPKRLAVIGGGPVGCEFAQAFARFGSQVTIMSDGGQLLPKEDPAAADRVARSFQRDGITLRTGSPIDRIENVGEMVRFIVRGGPAVEIHEDDTLLSAIGRRPNVSDLDLEKAGVDYDLARGVIVDDRLQTSNPRIYASGDVCSKFQFTHAADAMSRIVLQNALFHGRAKASVLQIPRCTYTDPEVAAVGLTEREAAEQGIGVDVYMQELKDVDRAELDGESEGFVKILVRKGTDQIVGATIVAANAGEMIASLSIAMSNRIGLKGIGKAILPYPTQSEAIRKIADAHSRTRLTPTIQWLFRKWFEWQRRG